MWRRHPASFVLLTSSDLSSIHIMMPKHGHGQWIVCSKSRYTMSGLTGIWTLTFVATRATLYPFELIQSNGKQAIVSSYFPRCWINEDGYIWNWNCWKAESQTNFLDCFVAGSINQQVLAYDDVYSKFINVMIAMPLFYHAIFKLLICDPKSPAICKCQLSTRKN